MTALMININERIKNLLSELDIDVNNPDISPEINTYISAINLIADEIEYMHKLFDFSNLTENSYAFNRMCGVLGISPYDDFEKRKRMLLKRLGMVYGDFSYNDFLSTLAEEGISMRKDGDYIRFYGYELGDSKGVRRLIRTIKSYLMPGYKYKLYGRETVFSIIDNYGMCWRLLDSLNIPYIMLDSLL